MNKRYFCSKCFNYHNSGKIYEDHKKYKSNYVLCIDKRITKCLRYYKHFKTSFHVFVKDFMERGEEIKWNLEEHYYTKKGDNIFPLMVGSLRHASRMSKKYPLFRPIYNFMSSYYGNIVLVMFMFLNINQKFTQMLKKS